MRISAPTTRPATIESDGDAWRDVSPASRNPRAPLPPVAIPPRRGHSPATEGGDTRGGGRGGTAANTRSGGDRHGLEGVNAIYTMTTIASLAPVQSASMRNPRERAGDGGRRRGREVEGKGRVVTTHRETGDSARSEPAEGGRV